MQTYQDDLNLVSETCDDLSSITALWYSLSLNTWLKIKNIILKVHIYWIVPTCFKFTTQRSLDKCKLLDFGFMLWITTILSMMEYISFAYYSCKGSGVIIFFAISHCSIRSKAWSKFRLVSHTLLTLMPFAMSRLICLFLVPFLPLLMLKIAPWEKQSL